MSVYIPGMEMPKSCYDCDFAYQDQDSEHNVYWTCAAVHKSACMHERREDCPLVPVPPHGDLIDRDALMKILSKVIDINASIEQRNEATDQERRCLWWFEQQIGIAPTIIPAEEGE